MTDVSDSAVLCESTGANRHEQDACWEWVEIYSPLNEIETKEEESAKEPWCDTCNNN